MIRALIVAITTYITLKLSYKLIKKSERLIEKENKSIKFYKEYIV